jgi:Flp pilus assembly protein TadG
MLDMRFLLQRVCRDDRGSIAIMFAASIIVLMLTVGLAIDGARAYNVSTRISAALDAAALAAAKMLDDESFDDAEIQERAHRFFAAQLQTMPITGVSLDTLAVAVDRQGGHVDVAVNVAVGTTLGQLAGISEFRMPRAARVTYKQKFVELAMVLDITGSMCQPCSKIDGLKAAAREAVANLINPSIPHGYSRVALLPYSAAVNAGSYAATVSGGASTDGCVVERQGAHTVDDHEATGSHVLGVSSHAHNPKYSCPSAPILPLTADRATLESRIDSLTAGGWTAGHIGLAWGWYMLSERWKDLWPTESRPRQHDPNVIKVVLMMTDGEFNTSYHPGGGFNSSDVNQPNSSPHQAKRLCDNMKSENVIVYSVAFQAPPMAESLLRDCATSSSHYFPASSNTELFTAFRTISERLAALRLSK